MTYECTLDWEHLSGNERVRFCEKCSKNVHNISYLFEADVDTLFNKVLPGEQVCLRSEARGFRIDLSRFSGLKAWSVASASVVITWISGLVRAPVMAQVQDKNLPSQIHGGTEPSVCDGSTKFDLGAAPPRPLINRTPGLATLSSVERYGMFLVPPATVSERIWTLIFQMETHDMSSASTNTRGQYRKVLNRATNDKVVIPDEYVMLTNTLNADGFHELANSSLRIVDLYIRSQTEENSRLIGARVGEIGVGNSIVAPDYWGDFQTDLARCRSSLEFAESAMDGLNYAPAYVGLLDVFGILDRNPYVLLEIKDLRARLEKFKELQAHLDAARVSRLERLEQNLDKRLQVLKNLERVYF